MTSTTVVVESFWKVSYGTACHFSGLQFISLYCEIYINFYQGWYETFNKTKKLFNFTFHF